MLPSFFIIGSVKAATTTVWSILGEHPSVFFPAVREPNYLTYAEQGQGWYEALYEHAGSATQRGDASPSYSMFPLFTDVPERAAALVPDARIIYMIRHPVRRMVSQWVQNTTAGHEHRPLEEAVVRGSVYYFASCYGLQLSRWAEVFPRKALLVLRAEDLAADADATIDRILAHLGLPAGWRPSNPKLHANASDTKARTPSPVRRISGALRGAGFERAAWHLTRRTPLKERAGLVRRFAESDLALPREVEAALLKCFRADFGILRGFLDDEVDLYGVA
jgi:hypothetical protein